MATKINIENLMPGSEAWWLQQSTINHPERHGDADGANQAKNNGYIPFQTEKKGVRTTYRLGVPGATIYPEGVGHTVDMPQPSLDGNSKPKVSVPQANPLKPTRTKGGDNRQPGMSEEEMENFRSQGNGEVVELTGPKDMSKSQAQEIAQSRSNGNLPEQTENKQIDRHQRKAVDESKADPNEVKALQNTLGLEPKGGNGIGGYDDIMAIMRANTLNEGDMARRQHSREIVTGLGDLVSSIANLWATTKGAPNSYDNSKGMTATSQSRYDRELARRKAQNEQILNYYRVKKAAEDDERIRKYREDIDAREQRRLDEAERHNKEMERLAAEKEQNNKEAKAEEQERKNKDSENKRNNDNKRANAYVAGQNKKGKGSTKKSSKSSSSNTPPSRRRGNSNGNNTRPSKRK